MALWNGLGQAATIAQLAGLDAGGLISAIVQAVQTVQRNKSECQQLVNRVMMINSLLKLLPQSETMRRPEIRRVLNELEDSLLQAYILVTSCQKSNTMYRFIMAGNQAQKFRDVWERINSCLLLYPVINHIDIRYFMIEFYSRIHPSGAEPQASEEMLRSFTGHLNPDSRISEVSLRPHQFQGNMADLALGVVKDIFKTGAAIKDAVEMVRHNEEECQAFQVLVDITNDMLGLQNRGLTSHQVCGALMGLKESLHHALKLVSECQKRTGMSPILTAGDMAKQLRWVQNDIIRKLELGIFAMAMELARTIVRYDGAHSTLTQPQGAAEMEIYSSHSTTGDAREVSPRAHQFHGNMADLAPGVVEDIVLTGMAIMEAVKTVRHNEEECQDIRVLVATIVDNLSGLQNRELTSHPKICDVLMVLNGSLHRAFKLVTECQKRTGMSCFLTAGDMAKQLRRVHDDIKRTIIPLGSLAVAAITMKLARTTIVRYDGAHSTLTQPQRMGHYYLDDEKED